MSKHLRIWLFALLGTLLTSTTLLAQGVITMTTSRAIGEEIVLRIKANGNVTIEGAQEKSREADELGRKSYRLKSQTITIRGDVTELYCIYNQLTSLNASRNRALTTLDCSYNQLTSLDMSKNTALIDLDCSNNQLTSLDVSKNTALEYLTCSSNQLTSLNVSRNKALTMLFCDDNKLTNLNISGCARLTYVMCHSNRLTNLNISGCISLMDLYCSSNCINGKAMTKLVNSLPKRRKKRSGVFTVADRSSKKRGENSCSATDVTTARRKNWEVRQ